MSRYEYWDECIAVSFGDNGIAATREQIGAVAADVASAHENYGMAYHQPENPLAEELARTKRELQKERDKEVCPVCKGKGRIIENFGFRSSDSPCYKCGGEGYYIPR